MNDERTTFTTLDSVSSELHDSIAGPTKQTVIYTYKVATLDLGNIWLNIA